MKMPMTDIVAEIEKLDQSQRWEIAWKAMDLANLVPIIMLSLDDIKEDLIDDEETYTDEQILEAMNAVSEGDWSPFAHQATCEVLDTLRGKL